MRLFIYKLLAALVGVYILFQLTIGLLIVGFKKEISELSSSENISIIKEKIRDEMKDGINKERIIDKSDSILIKQFIDKIIKELNNTN